MLADYNVNASDRGLREAIVAQGDQWGEPALLSFGARVGTADYLALGELANRYPPELDTHDRFSLRTDLVRFHSAYHALMETAIGGVRPTNCSATSSLYSPMPRLFRESPVNAIWEGSGNIKCLDVLRSVHEAPEILEVYFAEMAQACSCNAALDRHVTALKRDWSAVKDRGGSARSPADRLALGLLASLLVRHASPGHWQYGSLPLATIACGSSNGRYPRPTLEGFLAGPPVGAAQKPTPGDWPDLATKYA